MKISEVLSDDYILDEFSAKDKDSALEELCDFLFNKGTISNQSDLLSALVTRERLGSTGIGDNVAIPHAKSSEIDKILCVFGRSKEGIPFESLDEKPVHFICLLLAPTQSTGTHLKALARISRLLKSEKLRGEILSANDAPSIFSILKNEDAKYL